MKEHPLQSLVLAHLQKRGIFAWRSNTGCASTKSGGFVRFGLKGQPDVIAVYKSRFVGIELKGDTGRQSAEQRTFQAKCEAAGGLYILARALEDVTDVLR